MKAIDIIRSAQEKKINRVNFEINGLPVMLQSVDLLKIQEEIERQKSVLSIKYSKDGLDKEPSNEAEWNAYLKGRAEKLKEDGKTKEEIKAELAKEERPSSEADRLARKFAYIYAARKVIPTLLRDPNTHELLFDDVDSKRQIIEIVAEDTELMTLLASKFSELTEKANEVQETVKN